MRRRRGESPLGKLRSQPQQRSKHTIIPAHACTASTQPVVVREMNRLAGAKWTGASSCKERTSAGAQESKRRVMHYATCGSCENTCSDLYKPSCPQDVCLWSLFLSCLAFLLRALCKRHWPLGHEKTAVKERGGG